MGEYVMAPADAYQREPQALGQLHDIIESNISCSSNDFFEKL
jgi:hypothetical protein